MLTKMTSISGNQRLKDMPKRKDTHQKLVELAVGGQQ